MPGLGRTVLAQGGIPIRVAATEDIEWGMIGHSLSWGAFAALAAPYSDQSGLSLPAGVKMARFGQVVVPITTGGGDVGKWGPYDPAATDGRQALTRGLVGILDETVIQDGLIGVTTSNTEQRGVIVGGTVFIDRVLHAGTGAHSLAAGPTLAELLAAMPRLTPFYY